ncbi:uncharacterized protein PAC_03910 [Phialocephala subalpina]|uniref:DUF7907 domain-containing protein n=1 Tax=Phialocephala subalpina TaxID=576137 RepID=A0A1L7WMM0_9HELO|nr:uncharacterized protein PAC_03910 [Phialocephala subalpina]
MVSFTLSALTLGLVALSSARPGKRNAPAITEYAFTLQAEGYPTLTLNAVNSGTLGNLDFVFERPSVYPGTPAHFNGTKLQFDLNDPNLPAPYGMSFHDVGDNYGITVPVTAIFDGGKDGFSLAGDGTLGAPMDAAFNHFFACNGTVNGEEILQLKWGVFESNDENPAGCVA